MANDPQSDSAVLMNAAAEPEETLKQNEHELGGDGDDVGFVQALADWIIKHRSNWRDGQQPETQVDRLSAS